MAAFILLSDRGVSEALPALPAAGFDVKVEPLSPASLDLVQELAPEAVLVDAGENPGQGYHVLRALQGRDARIPAVAADILSNSW